MFASLVSTFPIPVKIIGASEIRRFSGDAPRVLETECCDKAALCPEYSADAWPVNSMGRHSA
jgi:hypothetical protein